jgi:hypothetical protein
MPKNQKFILGTPADDLLDGTDTNEFFSGFAGADAINAFGGNDHASGGPGNDLIRGGNGNDHLDGGPGNDALLGNDGNDKLDGDEGNDLLIGGAGNDHATGGLGIDTYLFRTGFGHDTVTGFDSHDLLDLNGLGFADGAAAKAAMIQAGSDVVLNVGGNQLVLENTLLGDISQYQIITSDQTKGPSSSTKPYLLSKQPLQVEMTAILTTGDSVPKAGGGTYKMAGIPDGLGAYDNGDGTFTVLMNHEINPTATPAQGGGGVVRDHGAKGAFVSEWVIDKTTMQVISGHDLIQHVFVAADNFTIDHHAGNLPIEFSRFCSADLADPAAFFNLVSGLGYNAGRLFLDGEESGNEGRPFAHIASGPDAGNSYELASLGNMSYENLVANAHTGDKTVVGMMDDTSPLGQVYFYFGDKKSTGSAIDKAGLTGGHLFGIHVNDLAPSNDAPNSTTPLDADADDQSDFSLVDLGDVSGMTGAQIQAASELAGVTEFRRPEDGAWDTINPNRFYFVTTNAFNPDDTNPTNFTQLWAVDFVDATNPSLGGEIKLLVRGNEKVDGVSPNMFDNITVNQFGKVVLCEDVGNQAHLGKVWEYDPVSDTLTVLAQHDPSRFLTGGANFLTQDEEASGVIDISHILGNAGENVYLIDTQDHHAIGGELVEGGQLQLIREILV